MSTHSHKMADVVVDPALVPSDVTATSPCSRSMAADLPGASFRTW
ncbi:hypothetical protein [Luteococcus sanguinis]|uniref:Uncharacterized protein n=1 Tax=Luteococcus sanguinis TaxID=174038 RepID=A0ABW1X0E2_9ACTN